MKHNQTSHGVQTHRGEGQGSNGAFLAGSLEVESAPENRVDATLAIGNDSRPQSTSVSNAGDTDIQGSRLGSSPFSS